MKTIRWKQWIMEEAERLGCHWTTLRGRLDRGTHPRPKIKRINQRVILVKV